VRSASGLVDSLGDDLCPDILCELVKFGVSVGDGIVLHIMWIISLCVDRDTISVWYDGVQRCA